MSRSIRCAGLLLLLQAGPAVAQMLYPLSVAVGSGGEIYVADRELPGIWRIDGGKLTKYFDKIQEIEVVFDATKDRMSVEMIVNAEHRNMFIAHHDVGDAYACIDGCIEKLERQLTEHKDKFRNRKHSLGEDKRLRS